MLPTAMGSSASRFNDKASSRRGDALPKFLVGVPVFDFPSQPSGIDVYYKGIVFAHSYCVYHTSSRTLLQIRYASALGAQKVYFGMTIFIETLFLLSARHGRLSSVKLGSESQHAPESAALWAYGAG